MIRRLQDGFYRLLMPDQVGRQWMLPWLFVVAVLASLAVFLLGSILWSANHEIGTLGDFIGGVLNPLLTFLTFMGLLLTIVLQQTELRDTREELQRSADALENQILHLDRQNFEATFFQMMATLNTIRSSIHAMEGNRPHAGISAITWLYAMMHTRYLNFRASSSMNKAIYQSYESVMNSDGMVITSYHRFFDSIIAFVEASSVDHKMYMRILQASLSEVELLMLFYRAILSHGDDVRIPVQKYALLKGMPKPQLHEEAHSVLLPAAAYGTAPFGLEGAIKQAIPRDGA